MAKQKGPNPANLNNPSNPKTPQKKEKGTGEEQVSSTLTKLEKERKQLLAQIAQIKKTITIQDKNDKAELDKIVELEKTRKKNVKEYYELSQKIAKLKREEFDRLEKTEKIEKDQTEKLKNGEKSFKTIRDYNKELEGIQEKSVSLMRSMSAETQNQSKLMGLTVSNTKALTDEMKDANLRSTKSVSVNQSFAKTMEGTVNIARELDSIEGQIAEGIDNLPEKQYEMIDLYQIERDLKQQIALLDMNAEKMGKKRYDMQKNVLQSYMSQLQRVRAINKSVAQQSNEMYKTKQSAVDTEKAMAAVAAAIPAGGIYKKMEMEKTERSSRTISDRLGSLKDKLKGAFEFTVNAFSGIFSIIGSVVKFFFEAALSLDKTLKKIGTDLNITRDQAAKVTQEFADMAMKVNLVGVNWEQFLETTKELSDDFGIDPMRIINSDESQRIVENMTILREKFQLTNEESKKFFELSVMSGQTMDGMAMRVDKMSKGIMSTRSAMKILATVPKSIQLNMKNALEDLIRFANKAKRMGMDMEQFKSTGDFLMDIEASLEAEMTAAEITGIRFKHMDAIRLAMYEGKSDLALDLIDASLPSLDELKRVRGGIIGQQAIGKAFGFQDYDKFVEMLTRKDAMKKLGLSMQQAAELERKNSVELLKLANQANIRGNKLQADYFKKLGLEKQNAEIMEKFEDHMTKIKMGIMKETLPVLKILHSIVDEIIGSGVFYTLARELQPIAGTIAEILKQALMWVLSGVKYIVKVFNEYKAQGKGFGDMISDLIKGIANTISRLLGAGDIFPIDNIKKTGDEIKNADNKAKGLKETMSGILSTGIGDFFKDIGKGIMQAIGQNKGVVLLAVALLALWKILSMFRGGSMGIVSSLAVLTGAIWVLSDAAEKMGKAGTSGQVSVGVLLGLLGGLAYGLTKLKGVAANSADITVAALAIGVLVGAIHALADSAKIFSESFTTMAKAFELIQNLNYTKINAAADAMDGFAKRMWSVMDLFMNSLRESVSGALGGKSPLEKIVSFIASVNMNRIMAFSGTMKHLAKGLSVVSESLKSMDDTKINSLWNLGKSLDSVGKAVSKSMNDSGGGKLVSLFGILHVMEATKIISVSNAIFYMAQSFQSVAEALNKVDMSKLNSVSLSMQGEGQKKDTSLWGSITRSGIYKSIRSFLGGDVEDRNRPVVNVPPPMFMGGVGPQRGAVSQTQNINMNTSNLEKKLDTMIGLLSALTTQKASIHFGQAFIDEIDVRLHAKRDLDAHIENTAARTLKR